jgi:hypothetical protein
MKGPNSSKMKRRRELRAPVTLTIQDLLRPVKLAHASLEKITRAHIHAVDVAAAADDTNLSEVKGMFVLAVSTLEVMLHDVIVCVLQHFPEKMAETQLKTKDAIGSVLTSDLLEA